MVVPSWYGSSRNVVHGSFFKEQFRALQNNGEKITVAYNEIWPITMIGRIKEKKGLNFNIEDGLRTYRYKNYNFLPKNPNMFKIFNRRMEKLYLEIVKKEGKVDIIHAHSAFWGGISAAYVAKKYNIPFVLTEHSSMKYGKYIRESYKKYIYNAYDSANRLIAVGNGLKQEMKDYTKNSVEVIHNLVDLSKFVPIANCKEDNQINLFSLSFLVDEKGMDYLIKAFNQELKNRNVLLKIGGDGPIKENLENLTKELELQDKITFLGALNRDEVVREMGVCDGFVLASEHETFGVVYLEAMAMGKPVLGTKNGGAEDIIKDYNGIIVENRDVDALAKGLVKFVDSLDEFDNNLIRQKVIENYSDNIIISKIKDVYASLMEEMGK